MAYRLLSKGGRRQPPRVQRVSRIGVLLMLLVVLIALFFGRSLERTFPAFADLLPKIGLVLLALGFIGVVRVGRKVSTGYRFSNPRGLVLWTSIGFIGIVLGIVVSEALIEFPIERIHFLKYNLLAICSYFAQDENTMSRRRLILSVVFTGAVGTLEETFQKMLPDRFFDYRDISLNWLSAWCGGLYAMVGAEVFTHLKSRTKAHSRDENR